MQAVRQIAAQEVSDFLERGEGVLLDVLFNEHFERRHIKGALSACVYEMVFLEEVEKVTSALSGKSTLVVLYGADSKSCEAGVAAEKLLRAGYENVAVYGGGLDEWSEKSLPMEGTALDATDPSQPLFKPEKKIYTVDVEGSYIRWTGRNTNGGHHGILKPKCGEVGFLPQLNGEIVLDMTTIENHDLDEELKPVLEGHLASDDFFFTKMFSEATLSFKKGVPAAEYWATSPNYWIESDFTMRGVCKPLSFNCYASNVEKGVALQAQIELDRTEWGVIYGSSKFFKHLGYHVVYDAVSVDMYILLV